MKSPVIPIAVVLAVVIAAGAYLVLTAEEEWTIAYELDGGELPSGSFHAYTSGDDLDLPVPTKDEYVFGGWYLEPGFDTYVSSTSSLSGDVTLYAMWSPGTKYQIGYTLNGGSFTDDYRDYYVGGTAFYLPYPERSGYDFGGWYSDAALTAPIVMVPEDSEGDINVYACWVESDHSGIGYTWTVSGSYYNGHIPHGLQGTVTQEMVAYVGGEHYYETTRDILYSWPGGSSQTSTTSGSWTGENMVTIEYVGLGEANGYSCTVWEAEDGTRYWLYNMDVQVRIQQAYGTTDIVYELTDLYSFEPETTFTPDVTAEYPLTVTGVRSVEIGSAINLTARGDGFTGWYLDGELISQERTVSIDRVDPSMEIIAATDGSFIVIDPQTETLSTYGFSSAAVVRDADGEEVSVGLTELDPGLYTATESSGGASRYLTFFIDDTRTFSHAWTHEGRDYAVSVDLVLSDVYMYEYENPYFSRGTFTDSAYIAHYHTTDDPYLIDLVGQLRALAPEAGSREFAEFVLYFVQSIDYRTDPELYGQMEYWAFPLEYLWNDGGDCEDSTIFYNTLMTIAGYDTAFLLFTDHAMSLISVEGGGRYTVTVDGTAYYLCETTTTGDSSGSSFDIGDTSTGHRPTNALYACAIPAAAQA